MASEMMEALMLLCQEKHIDELYLLDRLEQSLAKSYADVLHLDFGARVTIDRLLAVSTSMSLSLRVSQMRRLVSILSLTR